ncbi:hypothetical protein ACFV6U_33600 [Streptomyces sp. NPDC059810]|uniref:hypothetical protein n=1 Tax=Streptomyces sp. NPDC059810 TaxID=3346956 RepID=UPI00365A4AA0
MRTRTRTPLRTLVGLVAGATLALAPQAAALPAAPHPAPHTGETPASYTAETPAPGAPRGPPPPPKPRV